MLKITAIGNLTNDVELRAHEDGKRCCREISAAWNKPMGRGAVSRPLTSDRRMITRRLCNENTWRPCGSGTPPAPGSS